MHCSALHQGLKKCMDEGHVRATTKSEEGKGEGIWGSEDVNERALLDRQHMNPMERTISNTARVIHIRIVAKSVSPDRKIVSVCQYCERQ